MKINISKLFKGILITLTSLTAGFFAICFPFHIFDELSTNSLRVLFACEIIVYLVVAMIFLLIKDKKDIQKSKEKQKQIKRNKKIEQFQKEWLNIAA